MHDMTNDYVSLDTQTDRIYSYFGTFLIIGTILALTSTTTRMMHRILRNIGYTYFMTDNRTDIRHDITMCT